MTHLNKTFKLTVVAGLVMAFTTSALADNLFVDFSRAPATGTKLNQGRLKPEANKYNFVADKSHYPYLTFFIGKSLDNITTERNYEVVSKADATALIVGKAGSTLTLPGTVFNEKKPPSANFLSYTDSGANTIGVFDSTINFIPTKIKGKVLPSGIFGIGKDINFLYGGLSSNTTLNLIEQSSAVTTYSNTGLFENYGAITANKLSNVIVNSAPANSNGSFTYHNVGTLDLNPLSVGFKLSSGSKTIILNDGTIRVNQPYNVIKRFTSNANGSILRFVNRGVIDVIKPRYGGVIIDDDLQEGKPAKEVKVPSIVINDTKGVIFARDPSSMKGKYLFSLNDNSLLVNKGVIQGPIYTAGILANSGIIAGDITFDRNAALYLKGNDQQLPAIVTGNPKGNNIVYLDNTTIKNTELKNFNTLYVVKDSTLDHANVTLDTKPDASVDNSAGASPNDPFAYADANIKAIDGQINSQRDSAQKQANTTLEKAPIKYHSEYTAPVPTGKAIVDNSGNPQPQLVAKAPKNSDSTTNNLTINDSVITLNPQAKDNIVANSIIFTGNNTIRLTNPIASGYKLSNAVKVNSISGNIEGIVGNIFGQWNPLNGNDLIYVQNKPEQVIDAPLLPIYNQLTKYPNLNDYFNSSRAKDILRSRILSATGYEYGYLFDSFAHRLNRIGNNDQFYTGDNVPANTTNLVVSYAVNHNAQGQNYNHTGPYDASQAQTDNISYIKNDNKTLVVSYNKEVWPYYFDREPYANISLYGIYGRTNSSFETASTAKSTNFGLGSKITYHLFDRRLDLFTDLRIERSNIQLNRDAYAQNEDGQYTRHLVSNDYFIQGVHAEAGLNLAVFNYNNWSLLANGSYAFNHMTQSIGTEAPNNQKTQLGLLNRSAEFSRQSQLVKFGGALNYRGFISGAPFYLEAGANSSYEFGNIKNSATTNLVDPYNQKDDIAISYHTNYNPFVTDLYVKTKLIFNPYLSLELGYNQLFAKGMSDRKVYSTVTVNTDSLYDVLAPFNTVTANNLKVYRGNFTLGYGLTLPMHKEPYYTNKGYIFYYNYPILATSNPNFEYKLTKVKNGDFLVDIKGSGNYNFSNNWGINKQLKVNTLTAQFLDTYYQVEAGIGSSYKNDDYQAQRTLLALGFYKGFLAGFKYDNNTYGDLNRYIKNSNGDSTSDYWNVPADNSGIRVENEYTSNNLDLRLGYNHTWHPIRGNILTEAYFNVNALNSSTEINPAPELAKDPRVQLVTHAKSNGFTLLHNFLGEFFVKFDNFLSYDFSNKAFNIHLDHQLIFNSSTYWNFFSYKLQYNQTDDFYKDAYLNKTRERQGTLQASVNFKFANGNILNIYYNDKVQNYKVIDVTNTLVANKDKTQSFGKVSPSQRQYKVGSKYQQLGFNFSTSILPQLTLKVGMQYMLLNYFEPTYSSMSGNLTLTYNF